MAKIFDTTLSDSQATTVAPIQPKNFDFSGYEQYAAMMNKRCRKFWEQVSKFWVPGLKLIVVTYCPTPEEQAEAYTRIHEICGGRM